MAVATAAWGQPEEPASPDPRQVLAGERGLLLVERNHWLAAEEVRLRERLEEIEALGERYQLAQVTFDLALEAHRRLNRQATNEDAGLLAAQAELVASRNEFTVAVLDARRLAEALPPLYAELAADEAVNAALAALGRGHRLGPLVDYQPEIARRAGALELAALGEAIPLIPRGSEWQICGLLADETAVTFVLDQGNSFSMITATDLERAGIEIPETSPRVELSMHLPEEEETRVLAVREIQLPPVRFGGCVAPGGPAYVLPPEGEDLGSRFAVSALSEYEVTLEPESLQAVLRRRD